MSISEPITDELLVAYADGELTPSDAERVRLAVSADPQLAARVAMFQETRRLTGGAFAGIAREPIPAGLLQSVLPRRAVPEWRAGIMRVTGIHALAASALLGVLAAGLLVYTVWREPASSFGLLAQNEALLAHALTLDPDGGARSPSGGLNGATTRIMTGQTYRLPDGRICRTFEISQSENGVVSGLSCGVDGGWRVALAIPGPLSAPGSSFQPAGGAAADLAALLDAHHAEGPLAAEEVGALIRQSWTERK